MMIAGSSNDRDILGTFLIGAAVATGNPAITQFGIAGIVLPLVLLVAVLSSKSSTLPLTVGIRWIGAAYVAFIFLWYEQYKLFGDEGSVQLFITLTDWLGFQGHESVMRFGVGLCEILASILILTPALQGLGAVGALLLMTGAIFFHLATPLGVDPYGDGGVLFKQACSVWTCAAIIVCWQWRQIAALARSIGIPLPA
ncbi:DoxX family protein [Bradyrhizobium sp. 180]|uniref:DoxX family protein n=1 Tax=Bradyrhizobium sp. 180 TaxID=2782650 RepID=UPI001FF864AE|nr:DoxX family protein [Bradyrhizobium sp. 180]MCK1492134.1 DoxX family protein [Bradyrhizobium sp. 180]